MLPGKAFEITVGLGNDRDKNQTLQFALQAFINVVGFEQAIVWVLIKIDGDVFFESGFELCF